MLSIISGAQWKINFRQNFRNIRIRDSGFRYGNSFALDIIQDCLTSHGSRPVNPTTVRARRLKRKSHTFTGSCMVIRTCQKHPLEPGELLSPCGLNCSLCRSFIRAKNVCPGCRSTTFNKSHYCSRCKIRNCETRRRNNYGFCYQCDGFPCDLIKKLDKRYRTKYGVSPEKNLQDIEKYGVFLFLEKEKERWRCKNCGKLLCMHKRECPACGSKLEY